MIKHTEHTHHTGASKRGISLLLLIIIIIVMIIIAGALIFASTRNNPSENAKTTVLKSDIDSMHQAYTIRYGELLAQVHGDKTKITESDLKGIVPDKYKDEFKATTDGLKYVGDNEENKEIAKDMGIDIGDKGDQPVIRGLNLTSDDSSVYIEADVVDSKSGIKEYNFRLKKTSGIYEDHKTDGKSILIDGLQENTKYFVMLTVTDRAGNVVSSEEYDFTTKVPSNIETPTFSDISNEWTQGPISLTITYTNQTGAKHYMSYTGKDGDWQEVTSPKTLSITENVTVYAKSIGASGTESKIAIKEIRTIDNKQPEAPKVTGTQPSGEPTNQEVTLTVSGSTSPSGIAKYQYSTDGGTTWKDYPAGNKLVISEEGTTEVISRAVSNTGVAGSPSEKYVVKIDKTPAKVSSINVTSPASGEYRARTTVTVTVTYTENIKGVPVPELQIKFGTGNPKVMTPGTTQNNTITYTYTIQAGDNGKMATVSYTGGNMTDLVGNISPPENKPLGGNEIIADTVKPELNTINVVSPATDTYKAGTEITVRATYSEKIKGTPPVLKIKFGNGSERTTTAPGTITTGVTTIDYKYTIQAGDNGVLTSTSYTGKLTDVSGNELTVSNKPLGGNKITADTIAPTVSSLTVSSPGTDTYKAGTVVTIKATWSENVYGDANRNAVTASTAPVLKVKFGTGTERTATFHSVSGNIITYTYTIAAGDNGILSSTSYSGTVYDLARNSGTATNKTLGGSSITADTIAPTVSSLTVSSPGTDTYKAGTTVTIVATYSENVYGDANRNAVTASTAPVLKVKFGSSTERTATFKSASGNTITYTCTIAAGDNGILSSTSYSGTIYDLARNSGAATNKTLGGNKITADTVAPTVTSINVTNPAAGVYKAGQVVTIVAAYNENIYGDANRNAVTAATAPVLKVKFGSSAERTATFSSASGNTITYTYTIAAGDNGVIASTSYSGTIYDLARNNGTATNKTLGGNTITADTTAPVLNSIAVVSPASGQYKAGTVITIRATYNEPIKGTPPTLQIKFGSGTTRTATAPAAITTARTTIDYTYTIVSGDNGALATVAYTGSITDNVGNNLTVSNKTISGNTIIADTIPPTVTSSAPNKSYVKKEETFTYTLTLSEDKPVDSSKVTIVQTGSVTGSSIVSITGTGTTRVVTVKAGSGDGRLGIAIASGCIVDIAGNPSAAITNPATILVDNTAPTAGTATLKKADGSAYTNNSWTNQNVTVTPVNGSDTGSGHKSTTYQVTGANTVAAGTTVATTLQNAGTSTVTVTTTDNVGLSSTRSYTVKIDKTLPTTTITPNGGSYTLATDTKKAKLKATLTATDTGGSGLATVQYAWSRGSDTASEPTTWTNYTSGQAIEYEVSSTGSYYLWTKVVDTAGNRATSIKTSSLFTVITDTITMTPSTTAPTNQDIEVTINFGSSIVSNRKYKIGSGTLTNATNPQKLTITANTTIYAEGTDIAGNKVIKTLQITNIDKEKPSAPNITNSSNGNWTNQNVTITLVSTDNVAVASYEWYENGAWTTRALTTSSGVGTITYTVNRNEQVRYRAKDTAGNYSAEATTWVRIDKTAPTVSNIKVTSPAAGTYKAGQTVTIVTTYSETVKGTAPTLGIKFGSGATKRLSGTISGSTITYTYTIAAGDNGTLATVSNSGGALTDSVGNVATLSCPANSGNNIVADTTAPTVSNIKVTSPATGTYKAGQVVTIVATYSENIKGTAPALTIKVGSGASKATTAGTISGKTITYTYTITAGDNGTIALVSNSGGALTDLVGNTATLSCPANSGNTVAADTTAPVLNSIAAITTAGTYKAGVTVTIRATYSEPIKGTPPVLKIKFGSGAERTATAPAAITTPRNSIDYTYTIVAGDNGVLATTAYTGSITDAVGNGLTVANKTITGNRITADTTAPTIRASGPSLAYVKQGSTFTYTLTLSEDLVVDNSKITLVGTATTGAKKANVTGTGTTRTVTVTAGSGNGTLGIAIAAGAITDVAGNASAGISNPAMTTVDNVKPTVSSMTVISPPSGTYKAGSVVKIDVAFSEVIKGSTVPTLGIKFGSGTQRNITAGTVSGSKITYLYTIAAGDEGALSTVAYSGGNITDQAGNAATLSVKTVTGQAIVAKTASPTITVSGPSKSAVKQGTTFTYTLTLSEDLVLDNSKITLVGTATTGAKKANVTGTGKTRVVTVTAGSGNGTLGIAIAAGAITDVAGNGSAAIADTKITKTTVDNTAPGVTITSSVGSPTNAASITYTFTFTENVTGFAASDIGVTNGTKGTFSGSGKTYTLVVTTAASQNNTQTVSVGAGVCTDAAGNGNTAATSKSIVIDRKAPTCTITSSVGSPTNAASITYTFQFSENVSNFVVGDIGVTNGTKGAFTAVSGSKYTLVVTTAANQNNTQTVSIAAGVCTDAVGNGNSAASLSRVIDRKAPTCTITSSVGSPTNASSITYTMQWSENVTGFATDDITVTNGTKGTFTKVSDSKYTLVVTTAANQNNTQTISIPASKCTDVVGNNNTAASYSRVIDRVAPTCTITSSVGSPTNASSITYTFQFSENVTGFATADIAVTNGTKGTFTKVSDNKYTLVVTTAAGQNNTQTVAIAASVCTDAAGNNNTAASYSRVIDRVVPTITAVTMKSNNTTNTAYATNGNTVTLSMTFSETISTNPTVTIGGRTATVSGSGTTRTATYTIPAAEASLAQGTLAISISGYKDAATNTGATRTTLTSGSQTIYDRAVPAVNNIVAGTMLYKDPTFASGVNSTRVYNNAGGGTVTNTRVAISGAPESSGYGLEIKTTGAASPGHGGFTFSTPTAANKVFITRIIAKIPVGYTLQWASNATGDGRTSQWLTSQAGTGNWQEYAFKVTCGATGTFSSTNYYYLTGGSTATASAPVVWQVAYAGVIDTTKKANANCIMVTGSDTTGVIGYGINQSSTTAPSLTTSAVRTSFAKVFDNIKANGTYYVWLKDRAGNVGKTAVSVSLITPYPIVDVNEKAEVDSTVTGEYPSGTNPIVPKGFKPVDTTGAKWNDSNGYNNGLVIEDVTGDATNGSQFVWIPVTNYANFTRKEGYYNGASEGVLGSCNEKTTTTEATAVYNSVKNRQGFYMARYEAGVGAGMSKPTASTEAKANGTIKPVSKAGVAPWTFIPWGTGSGASDGYVGNDNANGAVKVSRAMYKDSTKTTVRSTLAYGVQWDAMVTFLGGTYAKNSTGYGIYGAETSANAGQYAIKNLYDIAGNVDEWTMEAYSSTDRVFRGGYYADSGSVRPVSIRCFGLPAGFGGNVGFRVALYV